MGNETLSAMQKHRSSPPLYPLSFLSASFLSRLRFFTNLPKDSFIFKVFRALQVHCFPNVFHPRDDSLWIIGLSELGLRLLRLVLVRSTRTRNILSLMVAHFPLIRTLVQLKRPSPRIHRPHLVLDFVNALPFI